MLTTWLLGKELPRLSPRTVLSFVVGGLEEAEEVVLTGAEITDDETCNGIAGTDSTNGFFENV
jgi:hypothetical protein